MKLVSERKKTSSKSVYSFESYDAADTHIQTSASNLQHPLFALGVKNCYVKNENIGKTKSNRLFKVSS